MPASPPLPPLGSLDPLYDIHAAIEALAERHGMLYLFAALLPEHGGGMTRVWCNIHKGGSEVAAKATLVMVKAMEDQMEVAAEDGGEGDPEMGW